MAAAAAGLGVALRLRQYVADPSLWVDEAALARNILDRSAWQLLGPLDYAQVAPPGFLLTVKLCTGLLGASELSLRLAPLLASMAGLAIFFGIARRLLRPAAAAAAILLYATAAPLLFFSSNLKQYAFDIAVTLIVLDVVLRVLAPQPTRRLRLLAAGLPAVAVFFSQAAVFIVTAAGVVTAADAVASRRTDTALRLAMVATWAGAVAASIAHQFASLTRTDWIYLQLFWQPAFAPKARVLDWIPTAVAGVFGAPGTFGLDGGLHYPTPVAFSLLSVVGAVALARREVRAAAIVVGTIALTLFAAAVHAHPFGGRAGLFVVPLFLLLVAAGADAVAASLQTRRLAAVVWLPVLAAAVAAVVVRPPPYVSEDLRPVIRYVVENRRPGDAVWVYYGAGQAFEYYRRFFTLDGEVSVGACARGNPREYLRQLDSFRGRARVWLLMSHDFSLPPGTERTLVTGYADALGSRLASHRAPADDASWSRAEAALYSFAAPEAGRSAGADRFPVPRVGRDAAWSCYGTMSPSAPSEEAIAALTRAGRRWNY